MNVRVRLYAQLRDQTPGRGGEIALEVQPGTTVLAVADRLGIGDHALEIMVNNKRAHNGIVVQDGDVISYFPALAGG